jgi:hypothetical protein
MPNDSALLHPFPITTIKVHVGSTDASSNKLHYRPAFLNFGFRDIFNSDVAYSSVNSGFQKESTSNNLIVFGRVLSLL